MEKLRATIEQYGRWNVLAPFIDRIEGSLESDFSLSVENAKSLLESISKEICKTKAVDLGGAPSFHHVLKRSFVALGYPNNGLVLRISGSLATIGQEIGTLRNEISPTSHGKPLDKLRERNNKIDLLTREFLIDSTVTVAILMIRAFEERKGLEAVPADLTAAPPSLNYDDAEEFNAFWDETYGEFEMSDYSYPASEILFNVDYQAYETEYKLFLASEPEETIEV